MYKPYVTATPKNGKANHDEIKIFDISYKTNILSNCLKKSLAFINSIS